MQIQFETSSSPIEVLGLFIKEVGFILKSILTWVEKTQTVDSSVEMDDVVDELIGYIESATKNNLAVIDYFSSNKFQNNFIENKKGSVQSFDQYLLPEELLGDFVRILREPISIMANYTNFFTDQILSQEMLISLSANIPNTITYLIDISLCIQNYQRIWVILGSDKEETFDNNMPGAFSEIIQAKKLAQFLHLSTPAITSIKDGLISIYNYVAQNQRNKAKYWLGRLANFNYVNELFDMIEAFQDVEYKAIGYSAQDQRQLSPTDISKQLILELKSHLTSIQDWRSELLATKDLNLWHKGATDFSDLAHKLYQLWKTANQDLEKWLNLIEGE